MTEHEKMQKGLLYLAFDDSLLADRQSAKELLFDFNSLRPSQKQERNALLQKLFGRAGNDIWVESPFQCDYGYNIHVGNNFYANHNCIILDGAKVTIGDNVLLGPNVGLYTAGHPLDVEQRIKGYEYAYPITIGNNVWIGAGVSILPGVTVGDNSVIGAGSVVTKDLAANVVAVGNPCKAIREIPKPRIP